MCLDGQTWRLITGFYIKLGKRNGLVTTLVVLGIVALALLIASQFGILGKFQNTGLGTGSYSDGGNTIVTSSTGLTFLLTDSGQTGTSVSGSTRVAINGNPFNSANAITTASPGNKLNILVQNGTTYHNAYLADQTVPSAPTFQISIPLNGNSTVTTTVFSTDNTVLTNGGGAINQTVATGGSYNLAIRMSGSATDNTQDMRCVFEGNSSALQGGQTGIVLTGLGATFIGNSKPSFYTLASVNNGVWVYDISPIVGAQTVTGSVQVNSQSSKTLANSQLVMSCFTKEYFIDSTNGNLNYAIEDSVGTRQSMANYKYTVQFQ